MNLFTEIDKVKKELPVAINIKKRIDDTKFNVYQKFAVILFIVCFILSIVFANLFPICSASGGVLNNVCVSTEFNFSLMLLLWFCSVLLAVFYYAIGHIILLLTTINDKMGKKK